MLFLFFHYCQHHRSLYNQVLPHSLLDHLDSPVPVVAGLQAPFDADLHPTVVVLDLDATVSLVSATILHVVCDFFL
jgi:hypothetical protein